jgi:hypothetical protein
MFDKYNVVNFERIDLGSSYFTKFRTFIIFSTKTCVKYSSKSLRMLQYQTWFFKRYINSVFICIYISNLRHLRVIIFKNGRHVNLAKKKLNWHKSNVNVTTWIKWRQNVNKRRHNVNKPQHNLNKPLRIWNAFFNRKT